jgi:hypothetical protein
MSELILENSLQCFFYDELSRVNKKSANPLSNETIYYSSLVMDKYGSSNEYFEIIDGKVKEKKLGLKLLEVSQLPKETQKRTLKDIGDCSLFLCGFFSDYLNRQLVDETYYQNIGKQAYKSLNSIVPDFYEVPSFYKRLSKKFPEVCMMVSLVAEKLNVDSDCSDYLLFVNKKAS